MRTKCARTRLALGFVLAIAMGVSLSSVDQLSGSAAEVVADQGKTQTSRPENNSAARPGVCEREAEKMVGHNPVRIGRSVRAPRKLRDVPPKYPELPPKTVVSVGSAWLVEVLISDTGKVVHVWPIREVEFRPPFPAFNNAVTDAIRQWEFEPRSVRGEPMPLCMTVTVNINWR